ncbi:uncharacterized protein [Lepeophtheirus salmonis]|nr:uncharacterized protein LOC121129761 isoform X2 [Lepeophtheirus salmonis]
MNHRSFFVGYLSEANISREDSNVIYNFFINRSSVKGTKELPIGNTNLTSYISEQRKNYNGENTPEIDLDCEKWDFYNSFVFTFTASTTIGYGQLSPVTAQGKLLCIFYSLIGIPINGILIGSLGSYFAAKLEAFQDSGDDSDSDDELKKKGELFKFCSIMFNIIIYLIPGVAVFVLIPALIFHYIEGWSYLDSVYYAYITLTTIGFGDFAAGRNNDILRSLDSWSLIYESFILIWIMFGLGYIFMIITIITDGIRKPVRRAVKKIERSFLKRIIEEVVNKRNKEYEKNGSMDGLTLEDHDKDLVMENDLYLSVNDMEDDDKAHLEFKNKLVEDKEEDNEDPFEHNRDTIKSLQHFFENNKKFNMDHPSPKLRNTSTSSLNLRKERRAVSMQHPPDMISNSGSNISIQKKRRISSYVDERSRPRSTYGSDFKPSITDMSFSEFLKNTTLEEFFVAANSISSPRNSVHNDPNVSSANSPQNSIHTGMKKLSTMASSGLEPFSKLFSNGTTHGTSQRRASSFSTSNRVSEPPTQIIVTSYSSASSESKDNEIRI